MGMLTTITFRNDEAEWVRKNPALVAKLVLDAMNGVEVNEDAMIAQKPVHSNDRTIYVCAGNTVTDVSFPYGAKMTNMMERFPDFFGEIMGAVKGCAHALTTVWAGRRKV